MTYDLDIRQTVVLASWAVYWGSVIVQGWRVGARIGRHPNLKPRGRREKALWAAWLVVILGWGGQPGAMWLLGRSGLLAPVPALTGGATLAAGVVLIVAGQAATFWCYRALGLAWRLGIRRRERTDLVTRGPYARVRHPIYVFQVMLLAGAACLLPTPLSLFLLAVDVLACLVKAFHEEVYLLSVHGQAYREYMARTGRFLPRL